MLTAILIYLRVALIYLQSLFIVNVAKGIASDEIKDAQNTLDAAVKRLDSAVLHAIYLDGKRKEWNVEHDEVMAFLSSLKYRESHDDVRNRRLDETGKWILRDETFLKWKDGSVKTLWCYGHRKSCYF